MPADAYRSLLPEERVAWMSLSPNTRQAILDSTPKKSPTSVNLHDMSAADYFSQEHQVDVTSVSAADFIRNISVNETNSNPRGPPEPPDTGITPPPPREANVMDGSDTLIKITRN